MLNASQLYECGAHKQTLCPCFSLLQSAHLLQNTCWCLWIVSSFISCTMGDFDSSPGY